MKVVDILSIAQDKQIIIVEISNRFFLMGVTSSSINMISELDGVDIHLPCDDKGEGNIQSVDFKNMITGLMPRNKK